MTGVSGNSDKSSLYHYQMRLMYAQFYAKYIKFYKYSIGIAVYF